MKFKIDGSEFTIEEILHHISKGRSEHFKQPIIDALISAERERDELRAEQADHDEQIARMDGKFNLAKRALDSKTERCDKAEAELARRDAAAAKPVLYALRFKNMQGEPEKEINDNCLFSSYEKARAYGRGGNYVRQGSGKIEWVPNAALDPEVIPPYTAAPPAVLPPEKVADDSSMMSEHAAHWYNQCRADALALGAQPQKPVVLPADRADDKSVSTFDSEKFYDAGWNSRGKADKEALDASNVPYEVKK